MVQHVMVVLLPELLVGRIDLDQLDDFCQMTIQLANENVVGLLFEDVVAG